MTTPELLLAGPRARAVRFSADCGDQARMLRLVDELTGGASYLVRDVTIGMPGDESAELVAEQGDFWFHTDAAFLPVPPRWMVIAVLEAESGGGLDVLPAESIDPAALAVRAAYLTADGSRVSPVLEELPRGRGRRIRYRRDRMLATGAPDGLAAVHRAVETAADQAVSVGQLGSGECLLVDNWTVLHRRRPFGGRRVIRRLWFDTAA
ncbi:TauD/TfdA family dioxygenase [Kitasatospora sp. MAP5-34]|uniref:TauD/TfdA family dioxygenase n=1 Tax=Kitasatospora sp. MAP5-34 TaxID=3035102 RepID=UPI002475C280|nr:TauD/TfdA family dioxygenase [Kitasatospora sp. MAP5-34]MDH6575442.1 hypothetical protein [Kitasatospora sp. MAP5-34]